MKKKKYIICAKEMYDGTSLSDQRNPLEVTEIATELVITRLYCIMLLKDGVIDKSDTIVTALERKCLYENIFDEVLDWDTFITTDTTDGEITDLLNRNIFSSLSAGDIKKRMIPYKPFYKNWERDKKEIQNINFSSIDEYDVSNKFVCLVIRTRCAWADKNLPKDYWIDLIKKLEKDNIKVFVFGKETEEYSTEKTQHIKNFRDWCSIVKHKNCKSIISTITGGVYPAFICGNEGINLIIIDNTNQVKNHQEDPSWYSDCINFTKINKNIINWLPESEELVEIIKNEIK